MVPLNRRRPMRRETLDDRERQLDFLHQEILIQRESLLHTTNIHRSRGVQNPASTGCSTSNPSLTASNLRNATLLQDIDISQSKVAECLNSFPNPRFVTLKNNYWSMVKNLFPLWEHSIKRQP